MTWNEYECVLKAMKAINIDLSVDLVTFITATNTWRGRLEDVIEGNPHTDLLLIECIDAHDTSGAGSDFVAVPLSQLVAVKHDAKKARYENSVATRQAIKKLKGE
jgi:hypothetical protein